MSCFRRSAICGSLLEFSTGLILPKTIDLTPNPEFQLRLWKIVSAIPKTFNHFQYKKIQCPWPRKNSLFSRTILRGRCDHSMVGPSPATHSCTSTIMFKANYTEVLCSIASLVLPEISSTRNPTQTNQPTTEP